MHVERVDSMFWKSSVGNQSSCSFYPSPLSFPHRRRMPSRPGRSQALPLLATSNDGFNALDIAASAHLCLFTVPPTSTALDLSPSSNRLLLIPTVSLYFSAEKGKGTMILSSAGIITFFHEKVIFRKSNSSRYVIKGSGVYGPDLIQHELIYPRNSRRRCECLDLYKELIPYPEAWSWQKSIVQKRATLMVKGEDHLDTVIVLQHPPVYTLGTGSTEEFLKFDVNNAPFDIYRVERGGEVTYHGPGQIVLYPIINLRYHKTDLHWYLRSLEEVVLQVLSNTFSIEGSRVDGLTGVWVGNQKIAAIGIKVSHWITFHGLALNVTTYLTPFEQIVPCGIRDRQVGSLSNLLGISTRGKIECVHKLMDMAHDSLLKEFAEVFGFNLEFLSNLSSLQEQTTYS